MSAIEENALSLGTLFLLSNLFVVLLTGIPVLVSFPDIRPDSPGFYSGADILRLLEPIVALPLQMLIFTSSINFTGDSESHGKQPAGRVVLIIVFSFACALYQQGAGFHSAANMFKNSIAPIYESVDTTPEIVKIYDWMRNVWEHLISHYIYAAGGILISWVYAYQFRNYVIEGGIKRWSTRIVWFLASLTYAAVISFVAIEFIKGSIVALCLIVIYGYGCLGTFLYSRHDGFVLGKRIVIQYYLLAYTIALVVVIGWMGKYGLKSRNEFK